MVVGMAASNALNVLTHTPSSLLRTAIRLLYYFKESLKQKQKNPMTKAP
jgi:hypothetical protein